MVRCLSYPCHVVMMRFRQIRSNEITDLARGKIFNDRREEEYNEDEKSSAMLIIPNTSTNTLSSVMKYHSTYQSVRFLLISKNFSTEVFIVKKLFH